VATSEFRQVDDDTGWETPPGYPDGITRKLLADDLDEELRTGHRTHLLRFDPGVFTTDPFVHSHWEEVLLIEGDLADGSDEQGHGGHRVVPLSFIRRPPGDPHGPFSSQQGCLLLEIHYYGRR
jgi:hypothetical protein